MKHRDKIWTAIIVTGWLALMAAAIATPRDTWETRWVDVKHKLESLR